MSKTGRMKCPHCEVYYDVFADPDDFKPAPRKPKTCGHCLNKNREPIDPEQLEKGWGPSQVFIYGANKEDSRFVVCPRCDGTGLEPNQ